MKGCAYSGMNFETLNSFVTAGPVLSSPTLSADTPIPPTDWGYGGPGSLTDNYSARWKGNFNFTAGNYIFTTHSDDGSRAYFDNNGNGLYDTGDTLLVNDWSDHWPQYISGPSVAVSGWHTLVYEMYERGGSAGYGLSWTGVITSVTADLKGTQWDYETYPTTLIPYVYKHAGGPYIYDHADSPMILYNFAPIALYWTSNNTVSCTLDGSSAIPMAGGAIEKTYFAPLSGTSHTYILSCTGPSGTTATDNMVVSVPPPPTGGSQSCPAPGTTATFSWTKAPGYPNNYLRYCELTGDQTSPCAVNFHLSDPTNEQYPGVSKSFATTPGKSYKWWVHTRDDTWGAWSDIISGTMTCTNTPVATANIKANGSDGPITILYNGLADITWTSSNATACRVDPPNWTELNAPSGTHKLNLTSTVTIYRIYCDPPAGGPEDDEVTVNVLPQPTFSLIVNKSGQGTVTSSPGGINCGNVCSKDYPAGTAVTLTAKPDSGRIFTGWKGVSCSSGNQRALTCLFTTTASSRIVYASFSIDPNYKEF
jgi:hypothetical protein